MRYCLSVDLGSEHDYTALSILERVEKLRDNNIDSPNSRPFVREKPVITAELYLRYLARVPLKTPYPEIVQKIKYILNRPKYVQNIALVVDRTGVGLPVIQMMYDQGLAPIGISIHGGETVKSSKDHYSVPKRDIITALLTAMYMKRLRIPPISALPVVKDFKDELANFRMKTDQRTGHDSYEAWLDRVHDDLVMSVAMGVWWVDRTHGVSTVVENG